MLSIINSSRKVQDIVNIIVRCRKGIKQFQQEPGEVEEFPLPPKEKNNDDSGGKQQQCCHSLPHIPIHVMVFDQLQHGGDSGGGRRTRTLLCK